MRRRIVLCLLVACNGAGLALLAGCGGSNDEHDRSVASQAAQQALAQERQRQEDAAQKAKLKNLQGKLQRERAKKKAETAAGGASSGSSGGGSSGGSGSADKDCGSGVTANGSTTCSFALNVADQYRASGGAGEIQVYSPVTKQTYTMSCSGSSVTVCTGGNNASVTIS